MASLDETANLLWSTTRPPLGLLAAMGCTRAATEGLSAEDRAPYDALTAAIAAWWPNKKRSPRDIVKEELGAVLAAYDAHAAPGRMQPALSGAQHLVMAMRALDPGSLALQELGIEGGLDGTTLSKLIRQLAKQTQTDLELWKGRLEYLLSFPELSGPMAAWPALLERTARIGFDRPMGGLKALPKPLAELARTADLGATWRWTMMGPKHALTLELGTTKRTAMLDDAQRNTLLEALPWLV